MKAQKLVELMMVSGVRTASGFEERIRFSELEIVDRDAIDTGVMSTLPEGNYINGWDVNVAGVRITSVKRNIRYHKHAVGRSSKMSPRGLPCLIRNRSSFSGSSGKASLSTLLADGTEISADSTSNCARNCPARYCLRCPRRIRPIRPLRICFQASQAVTPGHHQPRPSRPSRPAWPLAMEGASQTR